MKTCLSHAFSLVETVLSLAIISFSVVGMLGLFPVGLKQASASMLETHGAALAQEVFAALRTPSFEKVDCFGHELDLAALNEASPPVALYAAYPVTGTPSVGTTETGDTLYSMELRFRKVAGIEATEVTLILSPRHQPGERLRFQSIIARF